MVRVTSDSSERASEHGPIKLAEFLEGVPPYKWRQLSDAVQAGSSGGRGEVSCQLATPAISLYCQNEKCLGQRVFRNENSLSLRARQPVNLFVTYFCSNCQEETKIFALTIEMSDDDWEVSHCAKVGEIPQFGTRTPSRLISLIGDRELYLHGRKCENYGHGVGAFSYYRRIIENQHAKILSQIIKAAERLGATSETINHLKSIAARNTISKGHAGNKNRFT